VLSVYGHTVKVTEVSQDGDTLTFIIVSQKLSGTGEYHVDRTYDDFEWLQQHLFAQEDVPGIQGPPGRQKVRRNIFNRLSQAVGEMRKEGHKKFLDVVLTEQIAVACGHFAAALHLCIENGEDPEKRAFSVCVKLSEVFDSIKKNMMSVAVNDMNTLGLGLDLDSRYQEAEKEMLFRRTCKLVELENARKNAEKAKPVKKNAMEEVKKAAEGEFEQICKVAKQEVGMVQKCLTQWCEQQLQTAKEGADVFNQHLQ
uniref:Si:dkey-28n18.9 n=1 Tax=Poecilia latipinna TaxID=48699 RepID=A0A3B3V2X9_9TELE